MAALLLALAVLSSRSALDIDRRTVVQRHTVTLTNVAPAPPLTVPLTLTVGNGVIGFNADATGLQSLNTTYGTTNGGFPLTTLSDWGWHSSPLPAGTFSNYTYEYFNTSLNRSVPYPTKFEAGGGGHSWLRQNPHRLDIIQVALRRREDTHTPLELDTDILRESATQTLDPWTGELVSNFSLRTTGRTGTPTTQNGTQMTTRTTCAMDLDLLSWRVEGPLLRRTPSRPATTTMYQRRDGYFGRPSALMRHPSWPARGESPGNCSEAFSATTPSSVCIAHSAAMCDATPGCRAYALTNEWHGGFYPQLYAGVDIAEKQAAGWVLFENTAPAPPAPPAPLRDEHVVLRIAFPYGTTDFSGAGGDWSPSLAARHTTTVVRRTADSVLLRRRLDWDEYEVLCRWDAKGATLVRDGPHAFVLDNVDAEAVELSCLLAPPNANYPIDPAAPWLVAKATATRPLLAGTMPLPLYAATAAAAASGWSAFWLTGAFVDLADAATHVHTDPRAFELERRVVLSQYLTRVNSAGATPPQETGYTLNSWYGKHHHEMRWYHQAHFALWQRPELIQRSDGFFVAMLQNATAYANFQGYSGARWPKMVGPATTPCDQYRNGTNTCFDAPSVGTTTYSNTTHNLLYWTGPSGTGPMLIWQQPRTNEWMMNDVNE